MQQFGFEYHLKAAKETVLLFKTIRDLTLNEKFRLFSYDLNGKYAGCQKANYKDAYFNYAEIVLKRLDEEHMCSNFSIINRDCVDVDKILNVCLMRDLPISF